MTKRNAFYAWSLTTRSNPSSLLLASTIIFLVSACATVQPKPLPFELVQGKDSYQGFFYPDVRRMDATIGDKQYSGFYIQATSSSISQGLWIRRGFPNDTITTTSSNSARSVMTTSTGERLFCEFIFERNRALGECKTSGNQTFQLVAN